jgi:hypothetical protein
MLLLPASELSAKILTISIINSSQGNVVIRGLKYAQEITHDRPLTGHFGYLYSWYAFKAPEVDNEFFHDKSVDLWSLGATLYMLLTSLPPFRGDGKDLIQNKKIGKVEFDMVIPSPESRELIEGLLQVNPRHRFTIERVLRSSWMRQSDASLRRHDLSLAKSFFKDWNAKPKL